VRHSIIEIRLGHNGIVGILSHGRNVDSVPRSSYGEKISLNVYLDPICVALDVDKGHAVLYTVDAAVGGLMR